MEIGDILTISDENGNPLQYKIVEIDRDENGNMIGCTTIDVNPE